jgi:hypothetical protein
VVRIGSRKKAATHKVRPVNIQPIQSQSISQKKMIATTAATTTNLRPSGWTLGMR